MKKLKILLKEALITIQRKRKMKKLSESIGNRVERIKELARKEGYDV